MAKENITAKSYSSSYLYGKYSEYEKNIFKFIMNGVPVNKDDETFDDIRYEVKKRQVSSALVKVLDSKKVILMVDTDSLPKAFKVVAAKDVKADNQLKVFIDCTDIISTENGYKCTRIDTLISRLVSAMVNVIYYVDPSRVVGNTSLTKEGAKAFATLFTYVVDYLFKIGTMSGAKDKCLYLASMYYMVNILGKDVESDSVALIARSVSGISEREADIIKLNITPSSFTNIKFFIETCADALKIHKLTVDLFMEKWMYLYGTSTIFAVEMFPAFSTMMTDAYVGAYINNQKTIEKVAGTYMVQFTKSILAIGADSV